ncbi:MAG: TIGR04283 family arsenosugar biosynthesis glycosyltransferase [Thermoplasmata archaeon]|nr:MAG: TIGR04283 family arsenosugar biosynthesis glycosyltransferase [Thermoplasmata archaeon]
MAKDPTSVPVKTRLAASLGDEATVGLFRAFILDELSAIEDVGLTVFISLYPPGEGGGFREWLGHPVTTLPQGGADLGERIISSLTEAMDRVEGPVVTITSDVPDLPVGHLEEALLALEGSDAVLASSSDGGFHLIGLRRDALSNDLFKGVPWSTGRALEAVRERLESRGLSVVDVSPWFDVDDGSDAEALGVRLSKDPSAAPRTATVLEEFPIHGHTGPWLSVVIPVLHEEELIGGTVDHVLSMGDPGEVEVIVVDGDVEGSTLAALGRDDVVGFTAPRGRGTQMNAGASKARGEVLLFLHVDTRLPDGAQDLIRMALAGDGTEVGAFDISYGSGGTVERMMAKLGNTRARLRRVPYGENGVFMTRRVFEELGGYPDVPIMEDVEMMLKVKRSGRDLVFIDHPVNTSVRRFHQVGFWRTNARNMAMLWLHRFGAPPEKLAAFYPPQSEERRRWDWRPYLRRGKSRSRPRELEAAYGDGSRPPLS